MHRIRSTSVTPWLPAALAAMLALASAIPASAAPALGTGAYSVVVQGYGSGGLIDDPLYEILPFYYDSGVQYPYSGGAWQVTMNLSGGSAPAARVDGWALPGNTSTFFAGIATVTYAVRPNPLPVWAPTLANLPVPMTIAGRTYGGLFPLPGPTLAGFAEGTAEIRGPDFTFLEGYSVLPEYGEIDHTFSHAVSVSAGSTINVLLRARGYALGQWTAIADPTFEIDPTATFEYDGQTFYYADAFELEYSAGIVPEPSSRALCTAALLAIAVAGRTRRAAPTSRAGRRP